MPSATISDPLCPITVRLAASIVALLRAEAVRANETLSDALRRHISLDAVRPLCQRARRRPVLRMATSSVDPALLRAMAAVGNNLNQLARSVNTSAVSGDAVQAVEILLALADMRVAIHNLAELGT